MNLKIKSLKFIAGRPVAILNNETSEKMNIHVDDRIIIKKGKEKVIAVIDIAKNFVKKNEIAVSREILDDLKAKSGERVFVDLTFKPDSTKFIHEKLNCEPLEKNELKQIIHDIVENALTEAEIAFFVSAIYKCGMSIKETQYLIEAIVKNSKHLKLKGKVADKHSIGGIAGNRTTPIVVAICASTGLIMPKTSSRAITSAAGTADVIEAIAKVDFSIKEIYKIIKKTNACLVWGGALGLAPADDKIIQIEKIINLDPESQLLASILSKKIVVDSDYVLIDIPYGKSAKVSKTQALRLKKNFEKLAKKFNLKLKCILTDGSQPIGNSVGPILEIRDILAILKQEPNRPLDLERKSLKLSSLILEMTGKAKKGKAIELAKKILTSGKAFKKFQEIIKAQKGDFSIKKLKLARLTHQIRAKKSGKIIEIDNKKINFLAKVLGSPADKKSGIYFHKHKNQRITYGKTLLTFYAESKDKLEEALDFYKEVKPIKIK